MPVWQISFVPGRGCRTAGNPRGATPLSTQSPPRIPDPLDLLTSLADSRRWESLVYGTKGSPWRLVCLKSRRKTPSWWSRRTSASCSMVARCATVPVRGCTSKRSHDAAGTQDWYAIRVLAPHTSAGARRGAGRDPRLSLCNGEQGAVHQRPHGGAAGQVRISARHRVCQRWGGHRCGWCGVGWGSSSSGACTICPLLPCTAGARPTPGTSPLPPPGNLESVLDILCHLVPRTALSSPQQVLPAATKLAAALAADVRGREDGRGARGRRGGCTPYLHRCL